MTLCIVIYGQFCTVQTPYKHRTNTSALGKWVKKGLRLHFFMDIPYKTSQKKKCSNFGLSKKRNHAFRARIFLSEQAKKKSVPNLDGFYIMSMLKLSAANFIQLSLRKATELQIRDYPTAHACEIPIQQCPPLHSLPLYSNIQNLIIDQYDCVDSKFSSILKL